MEHIFAYRGYFVAAYTQRAGDGFYVGRAAICVQRPPSAARADGVERVSSIGLYRDEAKALGAAEFQAREVLDSMQPNWEPFTAPGMMRGN